MDFSVVVVLLILGGWFCGRLFERMGLPSVLGMTLFGVSLAIWFPQTKSPLLLDLTPFLTSLALVVILLRAGLGIRRQTLQKVGRTALALAILPCTLEGLTYLFLFRYLGEFSWEAAGAVGFLLAAVSPAVVVPSMLELKEQRYGARNGVPTLILAAASVDDVFAITLFSAFIASFGGSADPIWWTIGKVPLGIVGGIAIGVVFGIFFLYGFWKFKRRLRATEKALLLLCSSVFLLKLGEWTHTATLLGVMTIGFLLLEKQEKNAREVAKKLNKFWMVAQIWLFVLIGLSVDVGLAKEAGLQSIFFLIAGLGVRSIGVWIATWKSHLKWSERVFTIIAYLPKATVQAAMGAVPLSVGMKEGPEILAIAVLSIVVTAPLGLLGIRYFGPRLLERD